VTTGRLLTTSLVIAAGVLLPKILPAAVVGGRLHGRADLFLRLLPAALLAGLVTVQVAAVTAPRPRLQVVVAVVAAGVIAAVTRRGLLSMLCGWAILAAGTLL
jgi:branched-subunit amino acid transport protein